MSDAQKTVTEYRGYREKMKQLRTQYKQDGRTLFGESANALFTQNPELRSFGWEQYTPYFNDGDPCRFSAHIDSPSINGFNPEYGSGDGEDEWNKLSGEVQTRLEKAVIDFLHQFERDDYEMWFGDHAAVTVTPSNVRVEHYSHD